MPITTSYVGWAKGVDNIQPDIAVPRDALRVGDNIDVYDSGKIRRRKGSTLVTAGSSTHSLWSRNTLSVGYYVNGTTMYSFDGLLSTAVVTGLTPGAPVSYAEVNGEVFWSNGIVNGRIRAGVNGPWGLETPAAPTLTVVAGALPAGRYQVTTTYRNAAGEESGSPVTTPIQLLVDGGISMGFRAPVNASITQRVVYVSSTNGDILFKIVTLASSAATYTLSVNPSPGVALRTALLQPMPPGNIIAHLNGVMYVATQDGIWHSETFRFGLCNVNENFYLYPTAPTILLATPDGLYVSADKSYFISSPATLDAKQTVTLPFGGVFGTGVYLPDSTDVAWFSPRGQVIASGGAAKVVTAGHYAPGTMTAGASFVREQEGLRQIVNVATQYTSNPLVYTGA